MAAITSALVALTLFGCYPIGRVLGERRFFSASLLGAVPVALLAATLAHFLPLAIAPTLRAVSVVGFLALLWGHRANWRSFFSLGAVTALAFALLTSLYRPMFFPTLGTPTTFLFDPHSVYYSIQSVEMLRADYAGRLQVATQFGLPWVRFHFLGAGLAAVAQTWVASPGLESFLLAQFWIVALGLLAAAEAFLGPRPTRNSFVGLLAWGVLATTVFGHALRFQWLTSSALTVFAFFFWFWREADRRSDLALPWAIALSVSSARMLPVGILLSAFSFFADRRKPIPVLAFAALGALYLGATFLLGNPGPVPFFSGTAFSHEWFQVLSAYRPLGWIAGWRLWDHDKVFGEAVPFFQSHFFAILFYAVALGAGLFSLRARRRYLCIALLLTGIAAAWFSIDPSRGELLALGLVLAAWALIVDGTLIADQIDRLPRALLLALQFFSVLILFTGVNAIKAPMLYTLFDTVLFIAIGRAIALHAGFPVIAGSLAVLAAFSFRIQIRDTLCYPHQAKPIDIAWMHAPDFKRATFVDKAGGLHPSPDWNDDMREVASALLGAHIPWQESSPTSMTRAWADWGRAKDTTSLPPRPDPAGQTPPQTALPSDPKPPPPPAP